MASCRRLAGDGANRTRQRALRVQPFMASAGWSLIGRRFGTCESPSFFQESSTSRNTPLTFKLTSPLRSLPFAATATNVDLGSSYIVMNHRVLSSQWQQRIAQITFTAVFGARSLKISNTLIFSGELAKEESRNTARRGCLLAISRTTLSGTFSSKQAMRSPPL